MQYPKRQSGTRAQKDLSGILNRVNAIGKYEAFRPTTAPIAENRFRPSIFTARI